MKPLDAEKSMIEKGDKLDAVLANMRMYPTVTVRGVFLSQMRHFIFISSSILFSSSV